MKLALFGYGKMGRTIEKIAVQRGHEIVAIFDDGETAYNFCEAEVAIDFSTPKVAYKNIELGLDNHVAMISGTTGWLDDYEKITAHCKHENGAFLYASNFSLGVNLFFELNSRLAKLMAPFDYEIEMEEIHHKEKLDAPSGTAISLAEDIIGQSSKENWTLGVTNNENAIPIESKRSGAIPGTHIVRYDSEVDQISIEHRAKNRNGFALGAVIAAEWIVNKKGVFSMKDVLGI